jgi:hypothetical protein
MAGKRPIIITIWAVLLTISAVVGLIAAARMLSSGMAQELGLYEGVYGVYGPISLVIGLIVIAGIWTMRRWAFVLAVVQYLLSGLIFLLAKPDWAGAAPWSGWGSFAMAALFGATTLPYWQRMTWRPLAFDRAAGGAHA